MSLFSKVSTAHQAYVSSFVLDQIKSDIRDDLQLNYVFTKHLARQTEVCQLSVTQRFQEHARHFSDSLH